MDDTSDIDGTHAQVKVKIEFVFVAGLAVTQSCELLDIAEKELNLEAELIIMEHEPWAERCIGANQQDVLVGFRIVNEYDEQITFKSGCIEHFF